MNVYDFRQGRTIKNIDPQAAGRELERLREAHGTLTAEIVLEAAVDPESPLHAGFEWDDSAAAKQHRLNQARRLIVSLRVLNSPTAKPTVAFVSVRTPDKGRTYMPTIEAMGDEELRYRVLSEIRQFIEGIEKRYAHFEEVGQLLSRVKSAVA